MSDKLRKLKNLSDKQLVDRVNSLYSRGKNDDDEVGELFRRSKEKGFKVIPKWDTYEIEYAKGGELNSGIKVGDTFTGPSWLNTKYENSYIVVSIKRGIAELMFLKHTSKGISVKNKKFTDLPVSEIDRLVKEKTWKRVKFDVKDYAKGGKLGEGYVIVERYFEDDELKKVYFKEGEKNGDLDESTLFYTRREAEKFIKGDAWLSHLGEYIYVEQVKVITDDSDRGHTLELTNFAKGGLLMYDEIDRIDGVSDIHNRYVVLSDGRMKFTPITKDSEILEIMKKSKIPSGKKEEVRKYLNFEEISSVDEEGNYSKGGKTNYQTINVHNSPLNMALAELRNNNKTLTMFNDTDVWEFVPTKDYRRINVIRNGNFYTFGGYAEMVNTIKERKLYLKENYAKGGETSKLFELVINNGGKAEDLAYELNNDRMVGEPDFEWEHYGDEVYTSCQDDDFDLLNRYAVGIAKSEGFDVKVSKFEKGGEVEKKENNEMIIGGLAGILLGIFLNK